MDALAGVEGALATSDKSAAKKKAKTTTSTDETAAVAVPVPDPMASSSTTAAVVGSKKKSAKASSAASHEDEPPAATATTESTTVVPVIPAFNSTKVSASSSSDGKKAQISYNPDVNMTKEQLTAWRREMRRVRNRESAAASRRKVRDRIEELEEEVGVWKQRYAEAMAKLGEVAQV